MKDKIILIGGGSHCKVVIDIINSLNKWVIHGIVDRKKNIVKNVKGIKVIGSDEELESIYQNGIRYAFITIGSVKVNKRRNKLFTKLKKIGYRLPNIISDNSTYISENVEFGEGNFINSGVIINTDTNIGNNCIINSGVILEHNCSLKNNIHLAPGVTISGGTYIGNNCHIGTGTNIIQNIKIGKNCLVGAGSTVVKNIKQNSKVMGVPAKEVANIGGIDE